MTNRSMRFPSGLPRRTTATISLSRFISSWKPGSGTSSTDTSFSSSVGMVSVGDRRMTVVKVLLSEWASSRRARTTGFSSR